MVESRYIQHQENPNRNELKQKIKTMQKQSDKTHASSKIRN